MPYGTGRTVSRNRSSASSHSGSRARADRARPSLRSRARLAAVLRKELPSEVDHVSDLLLGELAPFLRMVGGEVAHVVKRLEHAPRGLVVDLLGPQRLVRVVELRFRRNGDLVPVAQLAQRILEHTPCDNRCRPAVAGAEERDGLLEEVVENLGFDELPNPEDSLGEVVGLRRENDAVALLREVQPQALRRVFDELRKVLALRAEHASQE